jgi:NAD(P) transhydrogenase subunit alpha
VRVVVAAERAAGERRVAAVPETVRLLTAAGWTVAVEHGAGRGAFLTDDAYREAGAVVVEDLDERLRAADVLLAVQPPPLRALALLPEGATVISPMAPGMHDDRIAACRERRLVAVALELIPRISRAQAMDVLTSQATVAGYRGALLAAERLPAFLPMLTTAAGTVGPARVLVLGTGVAGLQAMATARRLGADVVGHDIRPSSPEEVRSLGATFFGPVGVAADPGGLARLASEEVLAEQRRLLAEPVSTADAVIATAAVPGRPAPLLLTAEMVERMRPGSVVVDLAAEGGGNCALTRPGERVEHAGVLVLGPRNAPSELPRHASELFARNVAALLLHMTRDGVLAPDVDDEVLVACCVTRDGELLTPSGAGLASAVGPSPNRPDRSDRPARPDRSDRPARPDRPGAVGEVADLLRRSRRVVLVPGYGLAAAQAQHVLGELGDLLARRGIEVTYAVHPVAGRVPGHLNVVLDAAGVPHDRLEGLEKANRSLGGADVALLVGADDIANPSARRAGSPLSGMPVLDAGAARAVVMLKRSLRPGFAGVQNPLLEDDRTTVLLGDARETLTELLAVLVGAGPAVAPAEGSRGANAR